MARAAPFKTGMLIGASMRPKMKAAVVKTAEQPLLIPSLLIMRRFLRAWTAPLAEPWQVLNEIVTRAEWEMCERAPALIKRSGGGE
jgi:hypothetical protein